MIQVGARSETQANQIAPSGKGQTWCPGGDEVVDQVNQIMPYGTCGTDKFVNLCTILKQN